MLDVAEEPGVRLPWAELYRLLRAPAAPLTRRGMTLDAVEEDAAGRLAPILCDAAGTTHRPGGDPVAGSRAKMAPDFQAKPRRLYTDILGL